jgi:hypothetical protein
MKEKEMQALKYLTIWKDGRWVFMKRFERREGIIKKLFKKLFKKRAENGKKGNHI